jgi:hypothetical protein
MALSVVMSRAIKRFSICVLVLRGKTRDRQRGCYEYCRDFFAALGNVALKSG